MRPACSRPNAAADIACATALGLRRLDAVNHLRTLSVSTRHLQTATEESIINIAICTRTQSRTKTPSKNSEIPTPYYPISNHCRDPINMPDAANSEASTPGPAAAPQPAPTPVTCIVNVTDGVDSTVEAFFLEIHSTDIDDEKLSDLRSLIVKHTRCVEL